MTKKDITVMAAMLAAIYGTTVRFEGAQLNAAYKYAMKDMKG